MAKVNAEALKEKLEKLNATQQSIETISQWCIFFREDAKQIVAVWETEFLGAVETSKMLALIYLANDILQNSRKRGPQFVNAFYTVLPRAIHQLIKQGDRKAQESVTRMIRVWEERHVFASGAMKAFTELLGAEPPKNITGRKRGNVVLQTTIPTVQSFAAACQEAEEASARSQALADQAQAATQQEEGSAAGISGRLKLLQRQEVALQNEVGHRERIITMLREFLKRQEKEVAQKQQVLQQCQASVASHQDQLRTAQASQQPTPQPASGQARRDPRQQEDQTLEDPQGFSPAAPPLQAGPGSQQDDANGSMTQLLSSLAQQNGGAGGAAGGPVSAADLAAQLARSGTSTQMLLDALATLPKPQPSSTPGDAGEGDGDDEYDPEMGL